MTGLMKRKCTAIMIKNKKNFAMAAVMLLIVIFLNFPFPHRYPFGETVLTTIHIPIKLTNGFLTVGIISLIFLVVGLYTLVKSVSKYHFRLVVLTFLLIAYLPGILINIFQVSLAKDIYAVSYKKEESECEFEMINNLTLHGECDLLFENNSNKDVSFFVEFQE